jgi:hypothetical protein
MSNLWEQVKILEENNNQIMEQRKTIAGLREELYIANKGNDCLKRRIEDANSYIDTLRQLKTCSCESNATLYAQDEAHTLERDILADKVQTLEGKLKSILSFVNTMYETYGEYYRNEENIKQKDYYFGHEQAYKTIKTTVEEHI